MKWEKIGNNVYEARMDLYSFTNTGKEKMNVQVTFNDVAYTISIDVYEQVKKLLDGGVVINRADSLNNDIELARKEQMNRITKANL